MKSLRPLVYCFGALFSLLSLGEPPSTVSADQLYDFLLRSTPSGVGSSALFDTLAVNDDLREHFNKLIEGDRRLLDAAKKGQDFRRQYFDYLDKESQGNRFIGALSTYPTDAIWGSLETYRLAQRRPTEQPIRPDIARLRALKATQTRYGLSDGSDLGKVASEQPEVMEFYRRELWRRENDTESRHLPPATLDEDQVASWKQHILRNMSESRLGMARQALKLLVEKEGALNLYPSSPEGSAFSVFTRGRKRLRASELEKATFNILQANQADEKIDSAKSAAHMATLKQLGQASLLLPLMPNEVMRESLTPVQRMEAEQLSRIDTFSFGSGEIVEISWDDGTNRNGKPVTRTFRIPLQEIYALSALAGTSPMEREGRAPREWAGKDPAHSYLAAMALRDRKMREMEQFLASVGHEDGAALRSRLQKHHPRNERLQNVLGPEMLELRTERHDLVAGLEWQGYAQHPNHWDLRDFVAVKSLSPARFDSRNGRTDPEPQHRRYALADRVSTLGPWARAMTLWTTLAVGSVASLGAIYGVLTAVEQLAKMERLGTRPGSADSGGEAAIKVADPPKAWNKPLDGRGKRVEIYRLFAGATPHPEELPSHYDLIGKDNTGLRFSESHTVDLGGTGKAVAFSIKSIAPHFKGELEEVALPNVDGYVPVRTQLIDKEGNLLQHGKDYIVRQDTLSELFFLELTDYERWGIDEPFQIKVSFGEQKKPDNPSYEGFQKLDAERLIPLAQQLKLAGFTAVGTAIEGEVHKSKTGAPLDLSKLADVFKNSAVYSELPEGKPIKEKDYVNDFSSFAHFLKGGEMHAECDGTNQLFQLFLTKYFESDPNVSVLAQPTFVRQDRSKPVITAGDGHLRTLVVTRDGTSRLMLDATPHYDKPVSDRGPRASNDTRGIGFYPFVERRRKWKPIWALDEEDTTDKADKSGEKGKRHDEFLGKQAKVPDGFVTSEEHARRISQLQELKNQLVSTEAFKSLPRNVYMADQPVRKALQLSNLLTAIAEGTTPLSEAVENLHNLYPMRIDKNKIEKPSDLDEPLREILRTSRETLDRFSEEVARGQMLRYASLNNEDILSPARNLLRFFSNTNWAPVWREREPASNCDTLFNALKE